VNDAFRIVRQERRPQPAEARRALENREVADHLTKHRAAAPDYQLGPGLETAVNMALAVGAPLLVTGEPGTGKTQLAYFLADYFGIEVRPFLVKSITTARDLQYEFDAVGYLQSAYAAQHGAPRAERKDFLRPGPLWLAYERQEPSVLLIDEIDKAPRDFPNDLLHELDQGWFPHPFAKDGNGEPLRIPATPRKPPIVVITSNVERRLPGPFLRRCVFHHIELTDQLVRDAVEARAREFPHLPPAVRRRAIDRFWELREHDLQKPPSTAELLVWLAVLNALGIAEKDLDVHLVELPGSGSLIKDKDDLERLKAL
jgi:MoxR-like ATPase